MLILKYGNKNTLDTNGIKHYIRHKKSIQKKTTNHENISYNYFSFIFKI